MAKDVGTKDLAHLRSPRSPLSSSDWVDNLPGQGALKGRPCRGADQTFREDVVEDHRPVEPVPTPHPGIEYDGIQAGDRDIGEGDEVVIFTRAAESAGDELVRGSADGRQAAQVELDAEDVYSPRGFLWVVVRACPRTEGLGRCCELFRMFPETIDGILRLLDAPRGWY